MNNINQTLYIPLYGKAYVSQKGIILNDKQAEKIWAKEGFTLKGKAKSKWLAYYMGMRSAVIDNWLKQRLEHYEDVVVLHLGAGLDSRVLRINDCKHEWYDVDYPSVIELRKQYYQETNNYHMIGANVLDETWLNGITKGRAIIVMEGLSMYLKHDELNTLLLRLSEHFDSLEIIMDSYTTKAAKISKYKNPINDVGVNVVYGFDDPKSFNNAKLVYYTEHNITPDIYIDELKGLERIIFKQVFAGKLSHNLYRLYEFRNKTTTN